MSEARSIDCLMGLLGEPPVLGGGSSLLGGVGSVTAVHQVAGAVWESRLSVLSLFHTVCALETGKNRRLKQAKEEAQAEIEQYRLQREKEFKAKEAAVSSLHHSLLLSCPFSLRAALSVECIARGLLPFC